MKTFLKKTAIIFALVLAFVLGICYFISNKFDSLEKTIESSLDEIANKDELLFEDTYISMDDMVSSGNDGLSATPVHAEIEDYIVTIHLILKNNTGSNLELRDFATANFLGYDLPCDITSDNYTIDNGTEQEVKITFNIHAFKKANIIPTEINVDFGFDVNDRYVEYTIKNYISWE